MGVRGLRRAALGGLRPREERASGSLRCSVQHPEVVRIEPRPEQAQLDDESVPPECVATITYEALTRQVPVRGAGYQGRFGGLGWDGMWPDMSEIVRPTRYGIHGRQHFSTMVHLGRRPVCRHVDPDGTPRGEQPQVVAIAVP